MNVAVSLKRAMGGMSDATLTEICTANGLAWAIVARAKAGRAVNASHTFVLCYALGLDPFTGGPGAWSKKPPAVAFWHLGAGVALRRQVDGLPMRDAARAANVTASTICRIEQGREVSADNTLALMCWLGIEPEGFTRNHCNTLKRKAAA